MGTLQLSAIEEEWSRLQSWSVLPPSLLPRLMPTPGTDHTATPTGDTPTLDTTATTGWATGTDPAIKRDTGTTTARGPLRLSPRQRLTPGTSLTGTPTGATTIPQHPTGATTGTCTTGTDPATPSTGPSTIRGPLMPSPRLRLMPGTVPTTPTGVTAATGTATTG